MPRAIRLVLLLCLLASCLAREAKIVKDSSRRGSSALFVQGGKDSKKTKETETVSVAAFLQSLFRRIKSMLFPSKKSIPLAKKAAKGIGASSDSSQRIQRELKMFKENPPHNCEVSVGNNLRTWIVTITGVDGSVYAGEQYKLKFVFPKDYPSKPPGVYFLKPVPRHQHVYSNGDICLNLLGKDWRPTMTAELIAVSILSMLSSAKEKKTPQDNALHADNPPGQRQENWMYHDDKC